MDLLTVTCCRDRQQLCLQLSSIKRYLKGNFRHYIVINDIPSFLTKKHRRKWIEIIGKIYNNGIDFEIFFPQWNTTWGEYPHGWRSQQIYKFYYYECIKQDYIILDSKNFFIRTCSITDFSKMIGSGILASAHPMYTEINDVYAKFFECDPLTPLLPWTPFVVEYEPLKKFGTPDLIAKTLYDLKSKDGAWPSEFIWYSYLIKDRLKESCNKVKSNVAWTTEHLPMVVDEAMKDESIKIVGIHRNVLEKIRKNKKHMKSLLNFFLYFKLPFVASSVDHRLRFKKKT